MTAQPQSGLCDDWKGRSSSLRDLRIIKYIDVDIDIDIHTNYLDINININTDYTYIDIDIIKII